MNFGLARSCCSPRSCSSCLASSADDELTEFCRARSGGLRRLRSSAMRSATPTARSDSRARAATRAPSSSMPKVPAPGEDHRGAGALRPPRSRPASRFEPPGWISAVTPASSASCGPSANGKNPSEASEAPTSEWPCSVAFSTAIRTASTRLICPAPMPIVCRSLAITIAFEVTCLQTRQAKSRSPQTASSGLPATASIPSRSATSQSRSWTSRPPRTRLRSRSDASALRRSRSLRIRIDCFCTSASSATSS